MFDDYVTFQARLRPHAMALMTPERLATYAELEADVNRFALALRNLGVTPARGVVALRIQNFYLKHVVLLALARLGVASSPADDPGADLYLVDAEQALTPKGLPLTGAWVAATLEAEPLPVAPVRGPPETIVRVMLSSGTTKIPRRVARSWRVLEDNTRTAALTYLAGKSGRWVSMTGLDTGLGQGMTLAAWACGATLVAGINVQRLATELDALQPTIVGLTPIFLRGLLRALPPGFAVQPGLRLAVTGSVLSRHVALEARLRLSSDILISYGATESGSASMADGAWLETVAGCAGYASPGVTIEIVDAQGAPLPAGEQGEVRIKSERVADGYLDDPEATARCFRDGGFYPGDVGRLTPSGMLIIDGRKDERMNFGGVKYLPNLLEELAMGCPGVVDCACFAVPDAQGIDQCWLAVVTGEGFDRAQLAQRVEPRDQALPKVRFAWTEEIPRNASGKIERQRLRDETMAALRVSDPG